MARNALILGVDTDDGAYLARLLLARGYGVSGSGDRGLLARLGVADEVAPADPALRVDEVYDLRPFGADRAAEVAAMLPQIKGDRIFVAVPGAAPGPATAVIAAARATGGFVVAGKIFDRESRLGAGASFVARIVAAAFAGTDPDPADLVAATDCGWTPEYVDPMWRMLQRPAPVDFVLATGRALGGYAVALYAFDYFGRDTTRFDGVESGDAVVGDPEPARTALGWSATTWGRDLVRTLCEGYAEERNT